MLQVGLIVGCGLILLAGTCSMALRRARSQANAVGCASNLRQIGQAIQLYWQDYHAYPPDLRAVIQTQQIGSQTFTCPASSDVRAPTGTAIGAPGTCSYIYVGIPFLAEIRPDAVVALEDPANHDMDGGNVLYGDGHVEWVALPDVVQILNDLQQGINPPSANTALTKRQATKVYEMKWKALMPRLKSGVWRIPSTRPAG